jgi:hypothetical protein
LEGILEKAQLLFYRGNERDNLFYEWNIEQNIRMKHGSFLLALPAPRIAPGYVEAFLVSVGPTTFVEKIDQHLTFATYLDFSVFDVVQVTSGPTFGTTISPFYSPVGSGGTIGTLYPGAGGGAGSLYPGAGGGAGSLYPGAGGGAGSLYPGAGGGAGSLYPGASGGILGDVYPGAGGGILGDISSGSGGTGSPYSSSSTGTLSGPYLSGSTGTISGPYFSGSTGAAGGPTYLTYRQGRKVFEVKWRAIVMNKEEITDPQFIDLRPHSGEWLPPNW